MPTMWDQKYNRIHLENFDEAKRLMHGIQKKVLIRELTVPMDKVARIVMKASKRAFANEWNPSTRRKWPPLSPLTLMLRQYPNAPILQQTRALKNSIDYKVIPKQNVVNAVIGTQNKYALIPQVGVPHHLVRFRGVEHQAPIPARPFLGVHPSDKKKIDSTLVRWLRWYTGPTGRARSRLSTNKLPLKGFR